MRSGLRPGHLALTVGLWIGFALTTLPVGCGSSGIWPMGSATPISAPISDDAPYYAEVEINNTFDQANVIAVSDAGEARLDGALSGHADTDVYDLGPADAGDKLTLTVVADSGLRLSIGVFDADGALIELFRLRNGSSRTLTTICHHATDGLHVVVTGLDGASVLGSYTLEFKREAASVPVPEMQVLVLDFDGDPSVSIAGSAPFYVPPFNAALIDGKFAGQSDLVRDKVLADVRADFSGLNVDVRLSSDPGATNGAHSTIYFGTYNPQLLGLADNVDSYNKNKIQAAIIYTDTFALFSPLDPSVDEIARAMANVVSHEAGHLLGLWHVRDADRIMDITATARQMLYPQTFGPAPLHETVLPVGQQDAAQLLADTVGGGLKISTAQLRIATDANDNREDYEIDRTLLSSSLRCGTHEHGE
jgi:hypothetical protein